MRRSLDQQKVNGLAQAACSGDDLALAELVRTVTPRLLGFLRAKGASTHDAEDVVQDAWRRVVERLSEFDASHSFLSWMFVITRNLWIDRNRKARLRFDSFGLESVDASALEPADVDHIEQLSGCLRLLSDEYRQIIQLRFGEGLALQEVADRLDLPYSSVKGKCCRAIGQLRTCMGVQVPKKLSNAASAERG